MFGWFVILAAAFADANGDAVLAVSAGVVGAAEDCPHWRTADAEASPARHEDPLSLAGQRLACVERRDEAQCMAWRISVVRDHNGQLLVDAERDDPAQSDADLQQLALAMSPTSEKAAVLARWPKGSWNTVRACVGKEVEVPVQVPHRCVVVLPDGKPNPLTFGRGSQTRCAVAIGGESGAVLNGYDYPAGSGVAMQPGVFPFEVPSGEVRRVEYGLAAEHVDLWHVGHLLVSVPKEPWDGQ